ncbi:MAG: KdsC family phosphatase [Longimicrobiales bacterium]
MSIPTELARRVRLVILDVDGVLTDAGVYIGATERGEPIEFKRFDIQDGLGVKLLERAGIEVAVVSGRESVATRLRMEELGLNCHEAPAGYKFGGYEQAIERVGCGWDEVAVLGDDLPDLPALRRAGLPVAVANAVAEVRALARWRTRRAGGAGAVREFAEALLDARGERAGVVAAYAAERDPELSA